MTTMTSKKESCYFSIRRFLIHRILLTTRNEKRVKGSLLVSPTGEKVSSRRSFLRLATSVSFSASDFLFLCPRYFGPLTFNSNFKTFEDLKTLTFSLQFFVLPRPRGQDEDSKLMGQCLSRTE